MIHRKQQKHKRKRNKNTNDATTTTIRIGRLVATLNTTSLMNADTDDTNIVNAKGGPPIAKIAPTSHLRNDQADGGEAGRALTVPIVMALGMWRRRNDSLQN